MIKVATRFGTTYQYILKEYKVWQFDESFIHFIYIKDGGKRYDLIISKSEILSIMET